MQTIVCFHQLLVKYSDLASNRATAKWKHNHEETGTHTSYIAYVSSNLNYIF